MHKRFMKNVCTLKGKHSIELLSYMYLFWIKGEVARVRSCEGESATAKDRKCEDATRRCKGEVAKAKMRYFYRSFALASLYSRPKWSHRNTILMSTWSKIEILSSYNLQPYSDSLVSSSSGIMNYWIIYDHINIADSYVRNGKYHDANL